MYLGPGPGMVRPPDGIAVVVPLEVGEREHQRGAVRMHPVAAGDLLWNEAIAKHLDV